MKDSSQMAKTTSSLDNNLKEIEIQSLKRVGLWTPDFDFDQIVSIYLAETASVYVQPASSSSMIGAESELVIGVLGAALGGWQGSISANTYGIKDSIKKQTQVQEWIHWKKHAIDSPDFQAFREGKIAALNKMRQTGYSYIKSDKGRICIKYERNRHLARFLMVLAFSLLNIFGVIVAALVNAYTIRSLGVSLPEWIIQKIYRIQSFASIKPRLSVNTNGENEVVW